MTVAEIAKILDAKILVEGNLDVELKSACGSDMMSDVLAFVKDQPVLLTGLCNPQVIKTCDMVDMKCVVFVRGKKPDEVILQLAREKNISVLCSSKRLYLACGLLYSNGLGAGEHAL